MKSLQRQLIFWLVGLFTAVAVIGSGISFYSALRQVDDLLDHQLRQIALSIDDGDRLAFMQAQYRAESATEKSHDFVIQTWIQGNVARSSRPEFDLVRATETGFSNLVLHGSTWRAYSIVYPDRTVQVSQPKKVRLEIAMQSAMRVLFPALMLTPLSWLLVGAVVRRTLKPLERVAQEAAHRDAASLEPLPVDKVPQEILPLVLSMNDLISRLDKAFQRQGQFVSDAAHELRTPVAALRLQIDNLLVNGEHHDFEERKEEMRRGAQRASRLINQLLQMARYDGNDFPASRTDVNLNALVEACVADFIPYANSREIDLGIVRSDNVVVHGNGDDIRVLIGNLIDNAVRYTQRGGRVDISVVNSNGSVSVSVVDNGPGIPDAVLPRVFDRFFRSAGQETGGNGIGLAIVKAIAEREGAKVILENRSDGHGLIVRAVFAALDRRER